jgi:SAM-dependent methyltransferase
MKCPLCEKDSSVLVTSYATSALGAKWLKFHGFDPLAKRDLGPLIHKHRCMECDLIHFDPSPYGDAAFYERLGAHPWYYERDKWEFNVAIELLGEARPGSLLEIGCGEGYFLEKVRHAIHAVEGIDVNQAALEKCRAKNIHVIEGDVLSLEKAYDMIVMFEVLEHLENARAIIEKSVHLLNPGGHLVIATPNPDGYLRECGSVVLDLPPHHNSGWSRRTFEFLARRYGLMQIMYREEPLRYIHYLQFLHDITIDQCHFEKGIKGTILSKAKAFVLQVGAPLHFLSQRSMVKGQTHLVVLQKKGAART